LLALVRFKLEFSISSINVVKINNFVKILYAILYRMLQGIKICRSVTDCPINPVSEIDISEFSQVDIFPLAPWTE